MKDEPQRFPTKFDWMTLKVIGAIEVIGCVGVILQFGTAFVLTAIALSGAMLLIQGVRCGYAMRHDL